MNKPILIISALALGIAPLRAQDARYTLVQDNWTVNADGTTDYHHRHEVQILRNRALTAYADKGETFVVYNPDVEELTINEVYTLRADGSRVDMPQNAFVYQLPSECADCARLSNIIELAMVHTGMELGCTVVVDYTLHRRYGIVNEDITLCRPDPINRYEITVSLPADQKLGVQLTDPGVVTLTGSEIIMDHYYKLEATNLPATFGEAQLPPAEELYPTLHFYNGTIAYTPAAQHSDADLDPDAAAWARAVGGGRRTLGTVGLIRDHVRDYIHLNAIDPAHLAYRYATPTTVWRTGCGTAVDKAHLLAALLRTAGFDARVMDEVPHSVAVQIDTLTYALSVLDRGGLDAPYGKAYDADLSLDTTITLDTPTLDTLADGFYLFRPAADCLQGYDARTLPLSRTAPLSTQPCTLRHTLRVSLPKGMKLVGDKRQESLATDGLGSASFALRQKGRTLVIERTLTLQQSTVPAADYAGYRRLVALWSTLPEVILQSK